MKEETIDIGTVGDDLLRAYEKGLEDGKPMWISVKERLPEPNDRVLTFARFLSDGSWWMEITSWTGVTNHDIPKFWGYGDGMVVTHWMPLPESPKEESRCMTD